MPTVVFKGLKKVGDSRRQLSNQFVVKAV